jgi:DNA-binding transcriptional MerR regulator
MMKFRVKHLSKLAGVSVRTLHHYDRIGLLQPARMNEAGYRLYSEEDLTCLQEILFFKELDFSLAEIKSTLESPGYSRVEALIAQKNLLEMKIERLDKMIETIDMTISAEMGGQEMYADELFDGLDTETLEEYKTEARERWGESDAFKESERKTSKYTKADWKRIGAESSDIYIKVADLMEAGKEPSDSEVQAQTKRWFDHLCENFYTCTPEIFRGLADGYVQDQRFTTNIDKVRPGLAAFLSKAMKVYADSLE